MEANISSRQGLYSLLFRRLNELEKQCKKEIIPFPEVFSKLCSNFSITKKECWELLYLIKEFGFIEIVPFHGIKIVKKEFS